MTIHMYNNLKSKMLDPHNSFSRRAFNCLTILGGWLACCTLAIAQLGDVQPRACRPGETTKLVLTGKGLDKSLHLVSSRKDARFVIESITSEQAEVTLTLPSDTSLGPMGVWTATHSWTAEPLMMIVDDLPSVARDANNVSPQQAQLIVPQCAIAAQSRGSRSDFYRFQVEAGRRISFEIHSQSIHSPMDPMMRLMSLDGKELFTADEDGVGPDVRFSYLFEHAGDYVLEVFDSRYTAGGQYHLRVGDFPILAGLTPAAIQRGQSATITFIPHEGQTAENSQISAQLGQAEEALFVTTKQIGGKSSAWFPLFVTGLPVPAMHGDLTEASSSQHSLPVCMNGRLTKPKQMDRYNLRGTKDQSILVRSKTRGLGFPTLLKMQLLNSAGQKVAETPVAKEDEWSFEYKFPDDAEYSLVVSDLLGRFGSQFAYVIEVQLKDNFSLAMKGDAKSAARYFIDSARGAAAIDLVVKRAGYEGEIQLELLDNLDHSQPVTELQLLNPIISAGAKEARIYLTVGKDWTTERLALLQMIGRAKSQPNLYSYVSNLDLQRLQKPFLVFPQLCTDGRLLLAAKPSIEPLFSLDTSSPVKLARYVADQPATLTLKRLNAEFKSGTTILPKSLPTGWSTIFKADKDTFATTLTRSPTETASEPAELELMMFGEHNGQGYLENVKLPLQWFDPIVVDFQMPKKVVAGSTVPVTITAVRAGPNAPITITWADLPTGVQLPETIVIPTDQTTVSCDLKLQPDLAPQQMKLACRITSKFADKDFSYSQQLTNFEIQPSPGRLDVYPNSISLTGDSAKRQLVVTGFDSEDSTRDWTELAQITSSNPAVAEVRGSVVYPKSDGEAGLTIRVGAVEKTVAVRVENSNTSPRTNFESEVLVALSKQGCNSGACHGSPSGKGMFRLSLRAFDRKLDELTLIREEFGRRINSVEPERSLLLLKPLMKISHGGGQQIRKEDAAYKVLEKWIREGGKADPADAARCIRLEVFPNDKRTLAVTGGTQQLSVLAHFADGSQRDVTDLVAYDSSNQQIASIDPTGRITAKSRGEAVVLVRFLEHIESVRLACIDPDPQFHWTAATPNNYVDELVYEKLRQTQYLPAEPCTDSEFLRRVHLDVIGVLPSVDETRSFLGDASSDKRSRLINALLERPEYAKFWALKWGDLLKLSNKLVGNEAVFKYYRWIEDALRKDMPYDQFARLLITANGSTLANPPANFYRTSTDMNECVETISQVFLGARLQCAKCHNHPFERWTQDNYYGLAAFFNRVGRRETLRPGESFIYSVDSGEVTQPRTGQQMKPWLPVQGSLDVPADQDRRELLAQWLTEPSNPFFGKIGANRLWSHLFSRGIVDPVDDFRDSNPATNEPLLEALSKDFQQNHFSSKHLLRTILNSRTYQSSVQTNVANSQDTAYFSHQHPRLLKAEQLLDALNHTTGVSQVFGILPADWKATQLPAPDLVKVDFLKVFGQPERSTVCACERSSDSNLAMAIELFNGPLIHERLRDPNNRFRKALSVGQTLDGVLDELYLAGLCRLPNEAERTAAMNHLNQREDKTAGFEDICWALLNTDEFLFQH